jgi:hypothetical protein
MSKLSILVAAVALYLAAPGSSRAQEEEGPVVYFPLDPGEGAFVAAAVAAPGIPITYHGGAVMGTNPDGSNTPNLYYVWYGDWDGNTALDILPDFAANLGGSPYFNIETTYYDGDGNPVINAANYGGSVFDSYSQGTTITNLSAIVRGVLDSGALPVDYDGVYLVLTSADVTTSGFCSRFCAYHSWFTYGSLTIKTGFVGNPERCLSGCARNRTTSPNDNLGADGMANTIAHEFEEAVTDPSGRGWFDSRGQENADKCAWTFDDVFIEPNGSRANMTLGTRDYYIQRNWANDGPVGYCAQTF